MVNLELYMLVSYLKNFSAFPCESHRPLVHILTIYTVRKMPIPTLGVPFYNAEGEVEHVNIVCACDVWTRVKKMLKLNIDKDRHVPQRRYGGSACYWTRSLGKKGSGERI